MLAIKLDYDLKEMVCQQCGCVHAIPQAMYDRCARLGGYWHCPNGHSWGWEKGAEHTRIKELERKLAEEQARKVEALSRENMERLRADTAEKARKRLIKRASAGVCPCCNRTFENLARHMKTKHKDTP
jgi:RNase P subunit RPR2